jgi:hypothetical protein
MLLHVARCTLHAAACCTLHVARCMLLHVAAHCIAARYSHERTTALTGSSALDCCCCCNARSTAYTMQRTGHERVQRNEVVEDDVPKVDRPVAAQLSSASCSIQYTACNIQRAACNTQHSRCKTQPCKVQPCNTQPKHAARMKRGPSKLPRKYSPQRVTCSVRSQGRDQGLRPRTVWSATTRQWRSLRQGKRRGPLKQHDGLINPGGLGDSQELRSLWVQSGHRKVGHGLSGNAAVAASEWLSAVIPLSESSRPQ